MSPRQGFVSLHEVNSRADKANIRIKPSRCGRSVVYLASALSTFAAIYTPFFAESAFATQYYVSTKGQDTNSGRSPSQAWLHFWQASKVLRPGDVLTVLNDGTYDRSSNPCIITVSGTANAWITINSSGLSRPRITSHTNGPAIYVDANYVRIDGLDASSGPSSLYDAISIRNSHHVVVARSLAHDSGGGGIVATYSDYIWIVGNTVYRNSYANPNQPSGISLGYGLNYDTQPGVHNSIAGNVSYLNMNKSATPAGYTTDGNGIIIDRMVENGRYVGTSVIQNNVVHSNGGRGIAVWYSDNVLVRNNTAYHNLTDPKMVKSYLGDIQIGRCKSCSVHNNISSAKSSTGYAILALRANNTLIDHNLVFGGLSPFIYSYLSTNTAIGSHNIKNVDPRLDPNSSFKLLSSSPALGSADPSRAASTDILGTSRPASGPTDMGAYQQS